MKIIIAGDGKVGSRLAKQLSAEGYDLTLIDSNQSVLDAIIEKYDVITVNGNCATMDILKQAQVDQAELLITATSADEVNLLCCMTAHVINPKIHTIARIRNPEYYEQIHLMRDKFALSLAVNPDKQAADQIESLLKLPGFLKRERFAKSRAEMVELRIDDKSKLKDITLSDLNASVKCKVLVCAVLRKGETILPDGNFIFQTEDRILVTAPTNILTVLLKNLGIITKKVNRVLLAGGGRISYYLAQNLQKSGIAIQIIEEKYERCLALAELLPNADIIHGDASSLTLLESEGIDKCSAVVSLTGLDEMNIVISLYAKEKGVPHVITKLGHAEDIRIFESLPIGSTICPKELCADTIVRYVRAMENQSGAALSVHSIGSGQAEAVEFVVDKKTLHCNEPLKKIHLRNGILIASISRNGKSQIPDGDSYFQLGDTLIVVTASTNTLLQLNDIFE